MTYKLSQKKVLLSKLEVTYGVDPMADGTNGVLASNFTVAPMAATLIQRARAHETFGADLDEIAQKYRTIAFGVEMQAAGTAGGVPAYDALLQACGMSPVNSVSVSEAYTPLSTNQKSVAHYFFWDALKHKLLGSFGNCQIVCDGGTLPMFNFTFTGLYSPLTDSAPPGGVETTLATFGNATEVNAANTTFTLGGYAAVIDKFTLDFGNTVVFRDRPNAARVALTNRRVTGTVTFEATNVAAMDWLTLAASKTPQVLQLIQGTPSGAGHIVQIDAPVVQLGNPTETDLNGIAGFTIPLVFARTVGDDEFMITVK
jgi:hypothetical protein